MTIWLLQLPRLDDTFSWGLKEIENILRELNQPVEVLDINHAITKQFHDTEQWNIIEDYGILGKSLLPIQDVKSCVADVIDVIEPGDIVLSCVFTVESRAWFTLVHSMLRLTHGKELLLGAGGQGVRAPGEEGNHSEWADWTLARGLSDIMFLGETPKTMADWVSSGFSLRGKQYFAHDAFPHLGFLPQQSLQDDLDRKINIPNYYHYDYRHEGQRGIKIHFTQGCVKQCTFCDVWHTWPKFVMREPADVIKEINHYNRNGHITHISFPDNTINASNSKFTELLERFYDWKDKHNRHDITWSSQFAVKPTNQFEDKMFQLITATKGHLSVGFDHVSDSVLTHMKKLYRWQDITSFIERCNQHQTTISVAVWLVGYPTETDQDFDQYRKLIPLLKRKNTILSHNVSITGINRNSLLERIVTVDHSHPMDWHNELVNKKIRQQRKHILDTMLLEHNASYMMYRSTLKRAEA